MELRYLVKAVNEENMLIIYIIYYKIIIKCSNYNATQ